MDRIIIVTSQRQDRDATAHAACESKSLVGHRAPQDFAEEKANSGIVQYFPFAVKFFRKERLQLTRFSVRNKQC